MCCPSQDEAEPTPSPGSTDGKFREVLVSAEARYAAKTQGCSISAYAKLG
jgi:hypothetical protein